MTPIIAGRVIGLIDIDGNSSGMFLHAEKGYLIQDESAKMVIACDNLPAVGSIIEVKLKKVVGTDWGQDGEATLLAECEDFYISPKESPNYKRVIIDAQLRDNLITRSQIIATIRKFFSERQFIETDTPSLVRLPGMEPYLDVFKTRFEADFSADQKLSEDMYLITSPEYAMKKLLVGGMGKIFQITKSFRNKETFSERHNPEFTILEWYRAYASYLEIMQDTEDLIKELWKCYGGMDHQGDFELFRFHGVSMDLLGEWKRIRVIDAFKEYANIDEATFHDVDLFSEEVKKRGYGIPEVATFEDCFFMIFMNEIEPKLGFDKPTILYDYPVSMAALSKPCEGDSRFAERFELYIAGLEICNAFTELNDPVEQEKRLKIEREERAALGKEVYDVDGTFIEALKFGMPPSGGNALGVDRLIMLLTGEKDIRNVMWFPHRDL